MYKKVKKGCDPEKRTFASNENLSVTGIKGDEGDENWGCRETIQERKTDQKRGG